MTELMWAGKYKDGHKVAPLRMALPFQTVETVNESAQERQKALDLFTEGRDPKWRNRLIWGDKKYVLPSLLPEFAGKVNLIYIDPPFDTGANFSFTSTIPASEDDDTELTFVKQPSIIEQKAYRDTWGKGLDSYLQWFYETVSLLRELLTDDGSLYVHLDYHVSHYVKAVLDEVFGHDNFRTQIAWQRTSAHSNILNRYGNIHDTIFYYTKSDNFAWNTQYAKYSDDHVANSYRNQDENGRRFALRDLTASMSRASSGQLYAWKGIKPPGTRCWACSEKQMQAYEDAGRIVYSKNDYPRLKVYLDEMPGVPLQDLWTDIGAVQSQSVERLNYPTQKPEPLLERIIKASSNEGDLVLDCFCGSGTTAAVAEKLGRRWITCDLGRFAIHTARKRLLGIEGVKPFIVQNLGKYERQQWQTAEFGENATAIQHAYRHFLLELYKARPLSGYVWLHGVKAGRMVHIGSVDAPVSVGDVQQIAIEFRKAIGTGPNAPTENGVDVLGWDFAFETNEVSRQQAELANIKMRFFRIPREVLEKKAVEQGDIQFYELAALSLAHQQSGRSVTLRLTDFIMDIDSVPDDVRQAVKHWEQWIDYWAIDWDFKGDTFHNEWQSYRTRKDKALQLQRAHTYEQPGTYTVVVKVIDILGNDTTKTLSLSIA